MAVGRGARGPPLLARTRRVSSLIVTCGGSAERYIFQKNNRVATGTGTARAPPGPWLGTWRSACLGWRFMGTLISLSLPSRAAQGRVRYPVPSGRPLPAQAARW